MKKHLFFKASVPSTRVGQKYSNTGSIYSRSAGKIAFELRSSADDKIESLMNAHKAIIIYK